MQILIATNTFPPQQNPLAEAVLALASELREAGHQALVLAPALRGYSDQEHDLVRVSLGAIRHDPALEDVPFPSNFEPSIVHSFDVFGLGAAALAYAHRVDAPLVLTQALRIADYPSVAEGLDSNFSALLHALETRYAEMAAAVVAPDGEILRELDRRNLSTYFEQIALPVPRSWWADAPRRPGRRPLRRHPGDFLLGLIGRFAAEERTSRNLAAMGDFLGRSDRGQGVLVGDGPLISSARELAARADLAGRVHLLPPRGSGPLRRVLREVDAVLGTRGGAPLTSWAPFAEASGVPVLEDGDTALPPKAMASKALDLEALSRRAREQGRVQRRRRRWQLSGPPVAEAYRALYRRLRLQGAAAPTQVDAQLLRELMTATSDIHNLWGHLDLRSLPVESLGRGLDTRPFHDRKETVWKPTMPTIPRSTGAPSPRKSSKRRRAAGDRRRSEHERESEHSPPSSISA